MAHIHEDIDFTVSIFIVHANRVLLHVHRKYGRWLPPGGHIELTEEPNEAALREVKEECGLEVTLLAPRKEPADFNEEGYRGLIPPFYFNIHEAAAKHKHADFVFFATSESDTIVPEHENEEWRWFTKIELEEATDLLPSVRWYSLEVLKEVEAKK